jgi:hypothetical protein
MQRALLVNILRKLANAVEASNVADWEDFDIELKPSKSRSKPFGRDRETPSIKKTDLGPGEVETLLEQLLKASTREGASEILEKLNFTRKELEALARPRSVHVTKDDNVQRIKEKLIEAIVGSRLNSLAIRGK